MNRKIISSIAGVAISIACIYYLSQQVDLSKVITFIKKGDPLLLSLALLITFGSYFIRAARWRFFFEKNKPSYWQSYSCLIIGFFANNILPARLGEIIRSQWGGKLFKHSRALVFATIAAERLFDGLIISLYFGIFYLCFAQSGDGIESKLVYVAWLFILAGFGLVIGLCLRNKIFGIIDKITVKYPKKQFIYIVSKLKEFSAGLESLLKLNILSNVTIFSIIVWAVEMLSYYLIALGFNQNLDLATLSLYLAAVNFSAMVPAAPGGVGVIELIAVKVLSAVGISTEVALGLVVTQHTMQYLAVGIPGLFYVGRGFKLKLKNED